LNISSGRLRAFKGGFDDYLEQKELLDEQNQAAFAQIERNKKHLQSFVDRFGAKASKARQAQSRVKMIEKLSSLQSQIHLDAKADEMRIQLPKPPKPGRIVLTLESLTIGYPQKTLARDISLSLERGMKIAVVGANGIGKSTLLKTIMSRIPPLSGRIETGFQASLSYFAQDQLDILDGSKNLLENVLVESPQLSQLEARKILGGLLFRGQDVFKKVGVLSGGEKSRVGLACALARVANLLLLDEPTNHLDMLSVELLTEALCSYEGSMIFVSHDRDFINALCTHVFVILADGRNALFAGDLDDYVRLAKLSGLS
jgi:ATP-binding cassette, subfamily F, member 3